MRGNREFIAQALANLLDNAVKYTPAGGAVMLRVRRRASGEIEFSVTDTGPGVPEADRERVVDRFVRLENSRNAPGAGLGLSLVAAVADAHGGRLELDEGPGCFDGKGPGLRGGAALLPAGRALKAVAASRLSRSRLSAPAVPVLSTPRRARPRRWRRWPTAAVATRRLAAGVWRAAWPALAPVFARLALSGAAWRRGGPTSSRRMLGGAIRRRRWTAILAADASAPARPGRGGARCGG